MANVKRSVSLLAVGAASLILAAPALATFPGDNGAIAFARGDGIWTVQPDGTGEKRLASGGAPEWSPDGRELLFERNGQVYRMKADGSGQTPILPGGSPQFSPDAHQIAYSAVGEARVANADGSDARVLVTEDHFARVDDWAPNHSLILHSVHDGSTIFAARSPAGVDVFWGQVLDGYLSNDSPSWSPDGTRIIFSTHLAGISPCLDTPECPPNPDLGVRVMDVGGGGLTTIRQIGKSFEWLSSATPVWSPDGGRIAFIEDDKLRVMDADGQNVRTLTTGAMPDWQPLAKAPPGQPPTQTVTVTVPIQVPGPERVVEKVVTRTVAASGEVCPIPKGTRLTLTLRATKAIKKGAVVKVRVDLRGAKPKIKLLPRSLRGRVR